MTMSWFPSGPTPRGVPVSRRALPRRPVVLFVLALIVVGQTGCQSGPCGGPCGPIATTWRNLRETVARPFQCLHGTPTATGACCQGELGTAVTPLPYGTPAVVMPAPPGTTTTVPGASESLPSALEPIPQATPGAPPASGDSTPSQGAKSKNGKASYEAFRPRFGDETSPPDSLARTLSPSPAPTNRSAQGSRSSSSASDPSPLDNLPPLDLPRDGARADTGTPPAPQAAEREKKPTAAPEPVAGPNAGSLAGFPAPAPEIAAAPGIRRFAGVESKLAGGSLPTPAGLEWLVEKGYKTILDLREEKEISPSFIAEAARRGLRYVALPINVKSVDAVHVSRFESEIALADGRPLYFCDTDGTRPGTLWYVHRLMIDKVDAEVARRDAEELGLSDKTFWAAAKTYLDLARPHPVALPDTSSPKPAASSPAPAPAPSAPGTTPPATPAAPKPADAPTAPPAAPGPAHAADAGPPPPRDPDAWKPLAAMLVTGLGVPLAYVSRTAIPTTLRALSRASLPAPQPSPRSLPGASGG
jgi:protein tyrosine phosphatase (PTP) superfamily phosphohydrolase (DUF442 family)